MPKQIKEEDRKVVCSIALTPELKQRIQYLAKRKGMSLSELAGDLFEKVLVLNPDEDFEVRGVGE